MSTQLQVVEGQPVNPLTLIDGMNVDRVTQVMQTINNFQQIVQRTLREGHDYGRIPGAGDKPTLLKPGAEKILMIMGVTSEYEITEKVQDYETGFFAYTVRCRLSRNGMTITEGMGNCNSREKKYTSERQDKYVLANTCLKMAKKRAQVDAALTIGSLSDLFTQDIEDMSFDAGQSNGNTQQRRTQTSNTNEKPATDKQLNFIGKKAKAKGLEGAALDAWVNTQTGKHMDQLNAKDASNIIDALDHYTKEQAATSERGAINDDPFASDEPLEFDESELPF